MIVTTIGDEIGNTLIEQINIIKKAGINCIELRKVNNKYLCEYTQDELKEMKLKLDENKITVITVDTPIGKKDNAFNYQKNIELFKQYLNIAKILNAKYIRIFSDIGKYNSQENIAEVLSDFSKLAIESNIELLMENEKETFAESISKCKKVIKDLKNVKILFDVENSSYKNFDIIEEYSNNKEKIKYIHLRDYDNNKQTYTYIGDGTLPLVKLFKELKNDKYSGVISLETMLPKYNKNNSKEEIFLESYFKFTKKYQEA